MMKWTTWVCGAVLLLGGPAGHAEQQASRYAKPAGDARSDAQFAADCAAGIGLGSCVTPALPKDCPAGKHWSIAGTNIAHCISDDPVCTGGQELGHRASDGEPYCAMPVTTNESKSGSCGAGEIGSIRYTRTKTVHINNTVTYTSWRVSSDTCHPPPTVEPQPDPQDPTPTPGNPSTQPEPVVTGPVTPQPPPQCANGASDYPTCTPAPPPPLVCHEETVEEQPNCGATSAKTLKLDVMTYKVCERNGKEESRTLVRTQRGAKWVNCEGDSRPIDI